MPCVYPVLMYFSFIVMHYASTPVILKAGGLASHTYIYDHGEVLSGMARK